MNKNKSPKLGLEELENPFADLSYKERIKLIKSVGKTTGEKFPKKIEELQLILHDANPVLLLAVFSFYGLTWDGISPDSERKISQHHVELLQAFTLSNNPPFRSEPTVSDFVEPTLELINELSFMFAAKRFINVAHEKSENEAYQQDLIEYMRLSTQFTRNAGHPDQMKSITYELFSRIDDIYEFENNLKIGSLVKFLFQIVHEVEQRLNQHNEKLKKALGSKRPQKVIKRYYETFSKNQDFHDFLRLYRDQNWSLEQLRVALLNHSELFLPDIYTFSIGDLLEIYPDEVSEGTLKDIIKNWALDFGDLANENFEYFFMSNPVWKKPFVVLEEDTYFLPVPGLLVSFCVELLEDFISTTGMSLEEYHSIRGIYLEDKVADVISKSFPQSDVYSGSKWRDATNPEIVYENDLFVIVENVLIVLESKAGRIADATRRGAPKKLKYNIDELIAKPSEQANRFISKMQETRGIHQFFTAKGEVYEIDSSPIEYFIPISVILDFWGALSSHLPTIKDASLLPSDNATSIILSLFDLDIILDVIDGVSQTIHYLMWRQAVENLVRYEADEIDLLVVYLKDGFYEIVDYYDEGKFFNIYGESEMLNPYFMRNHHLQEVQKPKRQMITLFQKIIVELETNRMSHWLNILRALQSLVFEQQQILEEMLREEIKQTAKKKVPNQFGTFARRFAYLDDEVTFIIVTYGHKSSIGAKLLLDEIQCIRGQGATSQIVGIAIDIYKWGQHQLYDYIHFSKAINDS